MDPSIFLQAKIQGKLGLLTLSGSQSRKWKTLNSELWRIKKAESHYLSKATAIFTVNKENDSEKSYDYLRPGGI